MQTKHRKMRYIALLMLVPLILACGVTVATPKPIGSMYRATATALPATVTAEAEILRYLPTPGGKGKPVFVPTWTVTP